MFYFMLTKGDRRRLLHNVSMHRRREHIPQSMVWY